MDDQEQWPAVVTLDVDDLTLGEMAEIERQSGQVITDLIRPGSATRKMVALWVHASRYFARPRPWSSLTGLRLSDVPSSSSPSDSPDGDSPTSSD